MPEFRSRKEQLSYKKWKKDGLKSCLFCSIDKNDDQLIKETANFRVFRNNFPFSLWDTRGVIEHIMLVPKRHVNGISKLNSDESAEFIKIIKSYDRLGFNVYSRTADSSAKSIEHQHTHLIKLDNKSKKLIFFLRKPLIRWVR
jgi:diadenosine tetraphosphate (Ap4A) HIT family hydrolase